MQQLFYTKQDDRPILVEIDLSKDSINFFYKKEVKQWFYDIPITMWKRDYPFWQDHMKSKRWFTAEIYSFIDNNT